HPSWDLSENRGNSFPEADERALRNTHTPLEIDVHLAPEDPRRVDLEHRALSKLRRVMPNVKVRYQSATSIGIFEQTQPGYGEIWYSMNGRKQMSRVTTAEGVLESIYSVAGVTPPIETDEEFSVFRGHPLASPPKGAGIMFFAVWPGMLGITALIVRKRMR